ncbi:MAG: ABC transporter substrate-binding protein [Lachnospiraceae bacterium]|uniref:ABC transporter substrate-binding protein n=1 Tax=Candidatus Enterocloster excrementigallinarum TaxID=2838558 RepID=A0A9D2PTC7_9FIRM|nr:ABC transporter substrate-binding protein [Lachnospiraceae bacterium]HJC66049.1 ABC transporter substrate-binding protein [Candidatus Enterocloster excrementigallinarum]
MKKRYLSLGLAAVMAFSLTACGGSGSSSSESAADSGDTAAEAAGDTEAAEEGEAAADGATFKIGAIGPSTGAAAAYGIAVQNGADLAIKEINEAGGINGYQVEYNFQDDENDTEKAVSAYNTLKDWGMQMLVGTTTSNPCIAVVAETAIDNMFQITPSGSAVESISEPNAFRVCFSDPDQGRASAQYIGEHGLATKIGVIYDSSTEYSTGIYESFEEEAANQGLEIVAAGAFTADTNTDFTVQLTECRDAGAELVFLPIYYSEASTILKQASDMGFAPQFFGCDGMDGILTVENFDTSLAEGLMLLTPFSADEEGSQDFVAAYEEAYGMEPIQFAADAYDAVYAIKAAAEQAGVTPDMEVSDICEAMKVAMTEITIDGLTGEGMTWTEDGEPHKEPKAVMIVDGVYEMQN